MACRVLCRGLHRRRTQFLLQTRSFSPGRRQGELLLAHLQEFAPPPPTGIFLPSHLLAWRLFSSSPLVCNPEDEATKWAYTDDASRGISEEAMSNTSISSSQELGGDVFTNMPSPVDLMVSSLDTLHYLTGLPWWATISVSAVVLRALLVPSRVLQNQKLAEIKKLGHILQLERLAKGASQGKFLEEYRQLKKRKQGIINCPSLLWIIGPGILIQVPLVLTIMYSLRKMAIEQHLGFITGGFLWFEDLTVSGGGLTGAVLPLVVAGSYFANVHVLFRGRPVRQGPLGSLEKAYKTFLKCSTVFIFVSFYHLPQAVLMFFVPHSIMTLNQSLLFESDKSAGRAVGAKAKDNSQKTNVLSSYENLLKEAGTCFTSGNAAKAIELLEKAIEGEPEEEQAYALLGLVYKTRKDWVNSAIYYKQAILKGKTDNFKIAAYAGCGLALLKEGSVMDCVDTMRPIKSFKVPQHPETLHCYYASLVILGRALLEAGLNDESQEIVQQAKELNKHHEIHEINNLSSTPRD